MGFRIPEWVHTPLEHNTYATSTDLQDDYAEDLAAAGGGVPSPPISHATGGTPPRDLTRPSSRVSRTPGGATTGSRNHPHTATEDNRA
jgi:hypothetical protein